MIKHELINCFLFFRHKNKSINQNEEVINANDHNDQTSTVKKPPTFGGEQTLVISGQRVTRPGSSNSHQTYDPNHITGASSSDMSNGHHQIGHMDHKQHPNSVVSMHVQSHHQRSQNSQSLPRFKHRRDVISKPHNNR